MQDLKRLIVKYSNQLKQQKGEPDFFYLMRLIELMRKDLPAVGYAKTPSEEAFRFGQMPYLNFPSTSIATISESHRHSEDVTILVYFFGLLGVNGPMPLEITDLVYSRNIHDYDSTLRRFLDLINHRLLTLFYRAFSHHELPLMYDRRKSTAVSVFRALSGCPSADDGTRRDEMIIPSLSKFFCNQSRSVETLSRMLYDFFRVPVKVKPFVERYHVIPEDLRCQLGVKESSVLGVCAQLGSKYLTRTRDVSIEIGPISYRRSMHFMPKREYFDLLCYLVKSFFSKPVEFDITLLIDTHSILKAKTNGKFALGQSVHLRSSEGGAGYKKVSINVSSILNQTAIIKN